MNIFPSHRSPTGITASVIVASAFVCAAHAQSHTPWYQLGRKPVSDIECGAHLLPAPYYEMAGQPGAVLSVDVDADGDLDVVCSHFASNVPVTSKISVFENVGGAEFAPPVEYAVGVQPRNMSSADLNGDLFTDLVVVNVDSDSISVLLNDGTGVFLPQVSYQLSLGLESVACADMDADGDIDVLTLDFPSTIPRVSVFMNQGNGSLSAPVGYSFFGGGQGLVAEDLDGDGDTDVVTITSNQGLLTVLKNNGNGTLVAAAQLPGNIAGGNRLAGADLDQDGDVDLVLGSSPVKVCRNNGFGTFTLDATYNTPQYTVSSLKLVEIDGDSDVDIVLMTSAGVVLMRNNGNGTFPDYGFNWPRIASSVFSRVGDAADFDGDGDVDLAGTNNGGSGFGVILNWRDGAFGAPSVAGGTTGVVTRGDFDGDGDVDVASTGVVLITNQAMVSFNLGNGAFAPPAYYPIGAGVLTCGGMCSADLDLDGDLDLVAVHSTGKVSVLMNFGDGTFAPEAVYVVVGGADGGIGVSDGVKASDFDGDGDPDLAVLGSEVAILENNGNGTFAPQVVISGTGGTAMTIADFDGDGDKDLATTQGVGNLVTVVFNNGVGTFGSPTQYGVGNFPVGITSGDFDGDLDIDLAVSNYNSSSVSILHNNGDGTFAAQQSMAAGSHSTSIMSADLDHDGDLDLLVGNDGPNFVWGTLWRFVNDGAGNFPTHVVHMTGTRGAMMTMNLNGDGTPDVLLFSGAGNGNAVMVLPNACRTGR